MKDATDIQFEIDWINRPLQDNAVAQFPAVLVGQIVIDDHTLPIALPCLDLIFRNGGVAVSLEKLIGVGAKLREEVLRFLVLVDSSEPRHWHNRNYAGNRANLFAVIARKAKRQRNSVPHD